MTTRFPSSSGSARVSEVPGLHIRLPRARPQPLEAPPQPLEPRLHPQAPSLPGTQAAGSQSTNSAQRPESRALPSHWNIEPIPKGPSRPSETFPLTPSPVFKGPTTGNSLHLRTQALTFVLSGVGSGLLPAHGALFALNPRSRGPTYSPGTKDPAQLLGERFHTSEVHSLQAPYHKEPKKRFQNLEMLASFLCLMGRGRKTLPPACVNPEPCPLPAQTGPRSEQTFLPTLWEPPRGPACLGDPRGNLQGFVCVWVRGA